MKTYATVTAVCLLGTARYVARFMLRARIRHAAWLLAESCYWYGMRHRRSDTASTLAAYGPIDKSLLGPKLESWQTS